MNNTVVVGSDLAKCTHHVSLADGKKTIGLIIVDQRGDAYPAGMADSPIQRVATKTTSGTNKYGDFVEPWAPAAQNSWEGGRGLEDFSEDSTRFFDSYRAQTAMGEIYNAPLEYYSEGLRPAVSNYPNSVSWLKMKDGNQKHIALRLTAPAALQSGQFFVLLRKRGKPEQPLKIDLCGDNANTPGAVLHTVDIGAADIDDTISIWRRIVFSGVNLAAGSAYWIRASAAGSGENNYWQLGVRTGASKTLQSSDNVIWINADFDLYARMTDPEQGIETKFFTYKTLKFVVRYSSGSPRLFINGTLGVADSNAGSLNKLIDSGKTWQTDQWKGAVVSIVGGKGFEERSVYRLITGNDATSLTAEESFTIPQDTTTQYAIINTPAWTEIPQAQHGLSGRVTDVCVVNDIIYFAQGDALPIRRMRWVVSGTDGGWISESEESNAVFLATLRHKDRGLEIWRAQNADKNNSVSVSRATVIDWLGSPMTLLDHTTAITAETATPGVDFGQGDDTSLEYKMTVGTVEGTNHPYMTVRLQQSDDNQVFTTAAIFQDADAVGTYYLAAHCTKRYRRVLVNVYGTDASFNNIRIETVNNLRFHEPVSFHDSHGRINGIIEYAEEEIKKLWVFREGMVFTVKTDAENSEKDFADAISLPEMATVMEESNGRASITSNVYLYFTIGNGIQRFYNQRLDADGPDLGTGLPEDRQGPVSAMLAYPGRYFCAVDAGPSGYSSILMNNTSGWHEIYRAPNPGQRIQELSFQAIPTGIPDRLWFTQGDDVLWLTMPSKTLKAIYDDAAEYTHESVVISSWYDTGMVDIIKSWNSLKLMCENLEPGVEIEADYQVDRETEWHPLLGGFAVVPSEEVRFTEWNLSGKRLRYRLRLQTNDKHKTPRVKATVVESVGRVDVKYSFSFAFRNIDKDFNLLGEPDTISTMERYEILKEWAGNLKRLRMRSDSVLWDNRWVFLESVIHSRLFEREQGYIGTLTAFES